MSSTRHDDGPARKRLRNTETVQQSTVTLEAPPPPPPDFYTLFAQGHAAVSANCAERQDLGRAIDDPDAGFRFVADDNEYFIPVFGADYDGCVHGVAIAPADDRTSSSSSSSADTANYRVSHAT